MYAHYYFDLGRNALRYIVQKYKIQKIYIPYYLCDVIRHTLVEEGCKPIFYHINNSFYPDYEFNNDIFILYPNYFGICRNNIQKLAQQYKKLIVDNAHAFFDEPIGFGCFNAGHKFGFEKSDLWIKEDRLIISKINIPQKTDNISHLQENKKLRKNIFIELCKKYNETNILKIDNDCVPFVYPYLTQTEKEADELVKQLKKEGKIVYRYWSPLPKSFCEYKFYSRLVPIPILPH